MDPTFPRSAVSGLSQPGDENLAVSQFQRNDGGLALAVGNDEVDGWDALSSPREAIQRGHAKRSSYRTAMRRTANFLVSSASSSATAKGMSTSQAVSGSGAVLKIAWPQGW